jgi:hypothetical protein
VFPPDAVPPKAPLQPRQAALPIEQRRIGLTAWALFVVWGATVGTLYLADAMFGFGFGLVFLVVTSVVCTAIALTMDRWFGSVRW